MKNTPSMDVISRRKLLLSSASLAVAIPVSGLVGCGSSSDSSTAGSTTTDDSTSDSATDSSSDSSTDDSSSTESLSQDNSDVDWATGGTSNATVEYPNPFEEGSYSTCTLTTETTEGPCYSDSVEREDISEGLDGLPTRLCFRVVDENCDPVAGAVVDIWHCDRYGVYSGDGMTAVDFCTGGDEEYTSNDFFRGTQTTDDDGYVWFSTCWPSWYSSRAVHIHFMVIIDDLTYVTSQVGFADTLVDDIITNCTDYSDTGRGLPDTYNYDDTVFPSTGYEEYLLDTHKMSDGSLLAWKELMIDSSNGYSRSDSSDDMSGGGMGGTPPDGDMGGTPPGGF
ncbi:dioxygenase family protein [Oceanobacter kriegii]|uniref:dioxygenase family protein n=1 Tax=Oceanobacter kriegii TaxID=64972 RepID=UPI0003FCC3B0|nr:hypothetical protein [Oceanobacter kriegii]